jgi:hypothetical protein
VSDWIEHAARLEALMKAWHKVWDEGTTDQPLLDIPEEADQ